VPAAPADRRRGPCRRASDPVRGASASGPAAVPPQGRYLVMCGADVVAIAERDARGPKVVKVIEADA
jgi:hypothetical protein